MKIKVLIEYEFSQDDYSELSEEELRLDIYKDIEQFYHLYHDHPLFVNQSQMEATHFRLPKEEEKE